MNSTLLKATDLGWFDWSDSGIATWRWRHVDKSTTTIIDRITGATFDPEDFGWFKVTISPSSGNSDAAVPTLTVMTRATSKHATRYRKVHGAFTAEIKALKWIDGRYRVEVVES